MSAWTVLKWLIALTALAGLLVVGYVIHAAVRQEMARANGDTVQAPRRLENRLIKLGPSLARAHGLEDEPAAAVMWEELTTVQGRVVPNPQATFEVRTPFAGTLRAVPEFPWPAPGQSVRAGQVLGRLEVRVGPQDRLDFQAKLTEASAKLEGAEQIVKIHQQRAERLAKLTGQEVVAQRELDETRVQLAEARAQATAARKAADLWQRALDESDRQSGDGLWSRPLTAPADGEVAELLGQPGQSVEASGLVLQVVDFRRPLVRLDLPRDVVASGPPREVELYAVAVASPALPGAGERPQGSNVEPPLRAALLGRTPQVDATTQLASAWYAVQSGVTPGLAWRPGLFVHAFVKVPRAGAREAVSVPGTALLYHQGRALVYVRVEPGKYARREVEVLGRDGERWVVAARQGLAPSGVAAGEAVVFRNAQMLLSEEFRSEMDND